MIFTSNKYHTNSAVERHCVTKLSMLFYQCCLLAVLASCGNNQDIDNNKAKPPVPDTKAQAGCEREITAEVVALQQIYYYNRLGAFNPAGLIYALKRDVVITSDDGAQGKYRSIVDLTDKQLQDLVAKNEEFSLRPDKRPRPLVLRVNVGDCLQVKFTNLLSTKLNGSEALVNPETGQKSSIDSDEPATHHASMHVNGLDYVGDIKSDGANVGLNESSLVAPGETTTYKWHAKTEGGYLMYSMGAASGGEGDGGQLGLGLFGSVNVEPKGAKWYRSQVTNEDLNLATRKAGDGKPTTTQYGQPIINYEARYSDASPTRLSVKAGDPILNILKNNEIIYSDLNAIIDIDKFSKVEGKNEGAETIEYCKKMGMSQQPSCGEPYREFTAIFHDEITAVQAFSELDDEDSPFRSVHDGMGINYGVAGLGAMVLANQKSFETDLQGVRTKKRIGPAADCAECKLEEFFLSSWANGDPAMVVEHDAHDYNKVVKALFPDDPSNVHHSYMGDPVRFRNMHAGPKETHVFHLHAHQWLQDKLDPNSVYLDSQTISPGSSFSYEIQYGGSGNRNMTVGDSIFHCHLYPHFAQGMWGLWRSHDVFEDGTPGLFNAQSNPKGRNLPDAEIAEGTPNPAIVPLPRTPLPPMPTPDYQGYPYFIAGEKGHRPPQPPMDLDPLDYVDSSHTLRRHIFKDGGTIKAHPDAVDEMMKSPSDPSCKAHSSQKDLYDRGRENSACIAGRVRAEAAQPAVLGLARELDAANIELLNENGEIKEKRAMAFHAGKQGVNNEQAVAYMSEYQWQGKGYPTCQLGKKGSLLSDAVCDDENNPADRVLFRVNGQKEQPGAPFADPCPANADNSGLGTYTSPLDEQMPVRMRNYSAAYVQFDMTVNKSGWHDPQARVAVLEQDIYDTLHGKRAPEPLFFRARSGECVNFRATNLLPSNLNLDDFQVFSPTDVIGQHIHLVKFDVTSSDGSGNGWNYEDGTLSADEVRERIVANNKYQINTGGNQILTAQTHRLYREGDMANDERFKCPSIDKPNDIAAWEKWSLDTAKNNPWCAAQSTVQRWWADPLLNKKPSKDHCDDEKEGCPKDRTIRTVFSHDHFGPSSHQHHGLYTALVIEPSNSKWTFPNGEPMGGVGSDDKPKMVKHDDKLRTDGGPTSYAANIITRKTGKACVDNKGESTCADKDTDDNVDSKHTAREFGLAFADYAIVYDYDGKLKQDRPVNPTNRMEGDLPNPTVQPYKPEPEGISTKDPGSQLLNYRNEPIPLRVAEKSENGTYTQKKYSVGQCDKLTPNDLMNPAKAKACAGDMAFAFSSLVHGDPYTHLLEAYDGEHVQLRLIQGAQEENHIFNMHGVKWLAQPESRNSGWMNAQPIGISEHFEFNVRLRDPEDNAGDTDYLYSSTATDNLWDGQWGILRAYNSAKERAGFPMLPGQEKIPKSDPDADSPEPTVCDPNKQPRIFNVSAWHAREVLATSSSAGAVDYNQHFGIKDPNAILFLEDPILSGDSQNLREAQLGELQTQFKDGRQVEPLILRAKAGDCIIVNLRNRLTTDQGVYSQMPDADSNNRKAWSFNTLPPITKGFNFNQLHSSTRVSLHPQLVHMKTYDNDGAAIGKNVNNTVAPCSESVGNGFKCPAKTLTWYAGDFSYDHGKPTWTPVEFGGIPLKDMGDAVKHSSHGAIGALIIEPENTEWETDLECGIGQNSQAAVTVYKIADGKKREKCKSDEKPLFREFTLLYQDDLSLQQNGQPMANLRNADDAEDTGQKGFNYRTEPLWARLGTVPSATPEELNGYEFSNVLSSKVPHAGCQKTPCDPATPIFSVKAGTEVRFRVVHPAGHPRNHAFTVFGHNWLTAPWIQDSRVIGENPDNGNRVGSAYGIGPMRHLNLVIDKAGGEFAVPGDYLYRTQEGFVFGGGLWGIMCVYDDKDPKRCENRGDSITTSSR